MTSEKSASTLVDAEVSVIKQEPPCSPEVLVGDIKVEHENWFEEEPQAPVDCRDGDPQIKTEDHSTSSLTVWLKQNSLPKTSDEIEAESDEGNERLESDSVAWNSVMSDMSANFRNKSQVDVDETSVSEEVTRSTFEKFGHDEGFFARPKNTYLEKITARQRITKLKKPRRRKEKYLSKEERPYKCNQCSFRSVRISQLESHLLIHSGERPFVCKLCPFTTNRKYTLKHHTQAKHQSKEARPYKCNQCSFGTFCISQLENHLIIHSGEKPFVCEHCPFKTTRKENLKRHIQAKHQSKEDRPFKCGECSFGTFRLSQLENHVIIHTGEKPYVCEHCPYKTNRKGNLKRHMLTGVQKGICPSSTLGRIQVLSSPEQMREEK